MDLVTPLASGVVAGLALAVPVGAIGVLLVQEGATRGLRGGAAAATAVATVDLLYCVVAVMAGATVAPVIASWGPWPRVLGGVLLLTLAARSLLSAVGPATPARPETDASSTPPVHRFGLFVALTAVNPATMVYFAAVVTGLSSVVTSSGAAALFVVGVAVASLGWQLCLVGLGAALRSRAGDRLTRATTLVGSSAIAVFGVLLVAGALRP